VTATITAGPPPLAAVQAYLLFHETLSPVQFVGFYARTGRCLAREIRPATPPTRLDRTGIDVRTGTKQPKQRKKAEVRHKKGGSEGMNTPKSVMPRHRPLVQDHQGGRTWLPNLPDGVRGWSASILDGIIAGALVYVPLAIGVATERPAIDGQTLMSMARPSPVRDSGSRLLGFCGLGLV